MTTRGSENRRGPQTRRAPRQGLLSTIGNTPLIELRNVLAGPGRLFAKLEGFNPTGSLKDRIALSMVEDAERRGELEPGQTIIEATSGNTGISLAMVARIKGYRVTAVMPENVSAERRALLEAYGANLVLSPGDKGTNGAIELAEELGSRHPDCFRPDQYSNRANPQVHYDTTAAEILELVPKVDVFVAGLGTGGTLMGVGRRLKEVNPQVKIVAVQPYPHGGLQGLRNLSDGFVPPILDMDLLDESLMVRDQDGFAGVQELMEKEGVFAGISSGAVLWAAKTSAADLFTTKSTGSESNIVVLLADGGWKYMSGSIWTTDPAELSGKIDGPLW